MPSTKHHRLRWLIIFIIALVFGFGVGVYLFVIRGLPPAEAISFYTPAVATKVFDDEDNLIAEFFIERRELISLDEVPDQLKNGFICIEDKSFYRHWGVDLRGLIRAVVHNILQMRAVQGFSTITMQLARNMFLGQEKTVLRKLKEIVLAIRLERAFTKNEILEKYLNQVIFGQGRYGVGTAAKYYFNKDLSELTLSECALLVGLPKSPVLYNPYTRPQRAKARRDLVLREMRKDNYITEDEYQQAINEPLGVVEQKKEKIAGEYFIEEVRRYLEIKYGGEFLYRSGANIYTTMNSKMQKTAEAILEKHLSAIEQRYRFKNPKAKWDSLGIPETLSTSPYLQGALILLDQKTGAVKAMVGGRDFNQSKFNRATQAYRQTGSLFKVFVFAAAIDNGFTGADCVLDLPIVLEIPGWDGIYRPANHDHRFLGSITLRKALALSRNLVAVRLIRTLGPDLVLKYAHLLGIKSSLLPVVSLALGACEASLLELTHAFGTIANLGEAVPPVLVRKITDRDGTIIEKNEPVRESKLSPQVSAILINLMGSVVDNGTALAVRKFYQGPAAGKTGTTDNYSDAWFVGFTPRYTCGIWTGFDDNQRIFRGATGGLIAAPIWGEIMAQIDTLRDKEFPIPPSMCWARICQKSGLLATEFCPKVKEEIFIINTAPQDSCDLHGFGDIIIEEQEFERIDRAALDGY